MKAVRKELHILLNGANFFCMGGDHQPVCLKHQHCNRSEFIGQVSAMISIHSTY